MDRDDSLFDLMDNFKVGVRLISTYLATMLITLLIGVCIRQLAYRIRFGATRTPKLFNGYFDDRDSGIKRFPALAIFGIFVSQFVWQVQLFLMNNIKVSSINRKLPTTIIIVVL